MQYNAIQYNIMQCHKETKYTIWYNKMQFNTLQYCTIAYDTFQTKREHYWLKKGPFWAIGARKWPAEQSNGHLVENRRHPELPQDMWMLWSHWAGSIWGEIRGLFGSSVEKNWFSGQKCIFWGQNPNFFERHQIFCYHHDKTPKRQLDPVAIGTSGWPLHSLFGSKRAILGHRCQKTARRAAERARNGKPKVSRVTSEHGEVMIPSSWVCLRPKKWAIWA